MNLSKQIKELRARDGLSQEALAERIYVSRQTISNWETGKSYPDVHNLLLLGVLFNVSLDELVKGDIEMLKNELDVYKLKLWAWVMAGLVLTAIVIIVPMADAFGWLGLIPSVVLFALGIIAAVILERIKKKHNLTAYAEIVAFVENKPVERDGESWQRRHKRLAALVKGLCGAAFALVLMAVCFILLSS
jgi:transcriptional regulator with XRE-family HTH domain